MKRSKPGAANVTIGRALAPLLVLLVAAACGELDVRKSTGETHFLALCSASCADGFDCLCGACTRACTDSLACAEFGAGAGCLPSEASCTDATRTCDLACSADQDCAGLGSAYACRSNRCRQASPPNVVTCQPGCREIRAYPVNIALGCAEAERELPITCVCADNFEPTNACRKRIPEGDVVFALGMYPLTYKSEDPWVACSAAESAAASTSCAFASCAIRPSSVCSVADTCAALACGGPQYDAAACQRASCASDSECSDDERCVLVPLVNSGQCSPAPDGSCQCAGSSSALAGSFCNPVASAGPRGAWQELQISADNGLCVPGACRHVWTFTPDGQLVHETGPEDAPTAVSSTLSPSDLEIVREAIDGAQLRKELRDGGSCPTAEDANVVFRLTLPETTLERDEAGCAFLGSNSFSALYQLASRF